MARLADTKIDVKQKLAGLWASVMFCYVYGDYFELYEPGKLQAMLRGRTVFGPVTQAVLAGEATLLAVPALMVALSLLLPAVVSRWANLGLGLAYTLVMLAAVQGGWGYYVALGVVEMALTLAIAWQAWRWPKEPSALNA